MGAPARHLGAGAGERAEPRVGEGFGRRLNRQERNDRILFWGLLLVALWGRGSEMGVVLRSSRFGLKLVAMTPSGGVAMT